MQYSCQPGNALSFVPNKRTLVIHIVNNRGGWGKGFVLALSRLSKRPEVAFRKWARLKSNFNLGFIQPVKIDDSLTVVNMLAQDGYRDENNPLPLNYQALSTCLTKVASIAPEFDIIQLPKIGSRLGGGAWETIEGLLKDAFAEFPGDVRVRYQN